MPQYPTQVTNLYPGGFQTAMNFNAPGPIKRYPTKSVSTVLYRVIVVNPGTAGNLTINDEAALGQESAGNTIISFPYNQLSFGQTIELKVTCSNGLVASAIPTGGVFTFTYS